MTPLFINGLLTPEQRSKATATKDEKLEVIYTALQERISAKPEKFHMVYSGNSQGYEPALQDVGDHMERKTLPSLSIVFCIIFFLTPKR